MPEPRQLLCVLGMHRSGTSAVTQLLHRLGARVGPRLLDAMAGVNEDGFWEDDRVVDANERLFAALGVRWQDVAPLDLARASAALEATREEAAAYFREHYAQSGAWVVKDPRLCRLLPPWRDAWDAAGFETRYVHVLRHPFAVAKSLYRRDRIPFEYGVALWVQYTLEAMSHSAGRPGIVVPFDAFAQDPLLPAHRLQGCGDVRWSEPVDAWSDLAAGVLRQDLRHHDNQLPARTGLRKLTAFAAMAHATLCNSVNPPGEADLAPLRSEWSALQERYDGELAMLQRAMDDVMALSADTLRIGDLHSHALSVIAEKDKNLAEKTQLIKDIAYLRFWRVVPRIVRRKNGR